MSSNTGFGLGVVLAITIGGGLGLGVIVVLLYTAAIAILDERRKLRAHDRELTTLQAQSRSDFTEGYIGERFTQKQKGCLPISKSHHTPYPSLSGLEIFLSTSNDPPGKDNPIPGHHTSSRFVEKLNESQPAPSIQQRSPCHQSYKAQQSRCPQLSAIIESPYSQALSPESASDEQSKATSNDVPEPWEPTDDVCFTSTGAPNCVPFERSSSKHAAASSNRESRQVKGIRAKRAASMSAINRGIGDPKPSIPDQPAIRLHDRSLSLSNGIKPGPLQPPPALPRSAAMAGSRNGLFQRSCSRDSLDSTSSTGSSILEQGESRDGMKCAQSRGYLDASPRLSEERDTIPKAIQGGPRSRRVRSNIVHNRAALHSTHGSLGDNSDRTVGQVVESGCNQDKGANLSQDDTPQTHLSLSRPKLEAISRQSRFGTAEKSKHIEQLTGSLTDDLPGLFEVSRTTPNFAIRHDGTLQRSMVGGHQTQVWHGLIPISEEPGHYPFPNQARSSVFGDEANYDTERPAFERRRLNDDYTIPSKPPRRCNALEKDFSTRSTDLTLHEEYLSKAISKPHQTREDKVPGMDSLAKLPFNEDSPPPCSPRPRPKELPSLLKKTMALETSKLSHRIGGGANYYDKPGTLQLKHEDDVVSRLDENSGRLSARDPHGCYHQKRCSFAVLATSPPQLGDRSTVIIPNTNNQEGCDLERECESSISTNPNIKAVKKSTLYPIVWNHQQGKNPGPEPSSTTDIWATRPHLPPPKDSSTRKRPLPTETTILDSVQILRRMNSDSTQSIVEPGQVVSECRGNLNVIRCSLLEDDQLPIEPRSARECMHSEDGWRSVSPRSLSQRARRISCSQSLAMPPQNQAPKRESDTPKDFNSSYSEGFDALGIKL